MSLRKSLLHNEKEFNELKELETDDPKVNWFMGNPEKYPCICLFKTSTSDSGWDFIEGDFVYLDDFRDCVI